MKVALILCPSWTVESPSYTLALLSANIRKYGHSVKCFDLNVDMYRSCKDKEELDTWRMDEKGTCWYEEEHVLNFIRKHDRYIEKAIDKILEYDSKVIGFTVYSSSRYFSYEMARRIKERDKTRMILFGGPQCFKNCEGLDILKRPYIDAVCFGEGDKALPKMLDVIGNYEEIRRLPNFGIRDADGSIIDCGDEELLEDPSSLPYADYSDFNLNDYTKKLLPIATSRGCLGNCKFCNESPHWKRYRFRTAENICSEIFYQLSKYPDVKQFWFNDSLINGNVKMLEELCDALIESKIDIRYGGQALIRPEMDLRLLDKMKKSGCFLISYGLESGSNKILKDMRKAYVTETAEIVIRNTYRADIDVIFNIIIGYPHEYEQELGETRVFIERNLRYVKEIAIMPLLLLKGSYLYEHPEEMGIDTITKEDQLRWRTLDNKNNYDIRMHRLKLLKDIVSKKAYTIFSGDDMEQDVGKESFLSNLCIELSSACDMKCYMCAHYEGKSVHGENCKDGFMTLDTWSKILKSMESQTKKIESITLYWLGESLLNPEFKKILSQLLQFNMDKKIFNNLFLNTNGINFDSDVSNIILEYAYHIQNKKGYEDCYLNIHFSLETLDPVVYKRIKGVDPKVLDKVLNNIDFLVKERHRRDLILPSLTFGAVVLEDNAGEAEHFDSYWKEYVWQYGRKCETIFETRYFKDKDAVYFRCLEDISGTVNSVIAKDKYGEIVARFGKKAQEIKKEKKGQRLSQRRRPCFQLWNMFMISKDGIVTPCCKDRFLELEIGNIKEEGLSKILYGDRIKRLRLDHLNGDFYKYKLCSECSDPPGGFLTETEVEEYLNREGVKKDYDFGSVGFVSPKRLLNICLVSREYPVETGWGGIATYTYHLSQALSERGHNVHVICQGLDKERTYKDRSVIVHRVKHKNYFYNRSIFNEFLLRLEYSRTVNKKLKELINKYDIDIVEGPNLSAETFAYSFNKKTPIVTRLHTHFSEVLSFFGHNRSLDNKLSCWLEDSCIKRSDLVICSTRAHADRVAREAGINSNKIEMIPLGIELPQSHGLLYKDTEPYKVLYVGRLEERKGPQVLIRAIPLILKIIPDVEFVFIGGDTFVNNNGTQVTNCGEGSYKQSLLNNIPEEYMKNIRFLGYVDNGQLTEYFKSCSLFAAPSLYESFGFIYIEAMSYAKPVIGCGVGGVPEVIKEGKTGILVPPNDHVSLANAIIDLLKNEKKRKEMGINGRKDVESNFTRDLMGKRTEKAYISLLK